MRWFEQVDIFIVPSIRRKARSKLLAARIEHQLGPSRKDGILPLLLDFPLSVESRQLIRQFSGSRVRRTSKERRDKVGCGRLIGMVIGGRREESMSSQLKERQREKGSHPAVAAAVGRSVVHGRWVCGFYKRKSNETIDVSQVLCLLRCAGWTQWQKRSDRASAMACHSRVAIRTFAPSTWSPNTRRMAEMLHFEGIFVKMHFFNFPSLSPHAKSF